MSQSSISLQEAIEQVLSTHQAPIERAEIVRQVLNIRPSNAKNAAGSVSAKLRELDGTSLFILPNASIISMAMAMNGVRFRSRLSGDEVRHRSLKLVPGFYPFMRDWRFISYNVPDLSQDALKLIDTSGAEIAFEMTRLDHSALNTPDSKQINLSVSAIHLPIWLDAHQAQPGDSVLVTIIDWQDRIYSLEFEPSAVQQTHLIAAQNRVLEEAIYRQVGEEWSYSAPTSSVILRVYADHREALGDYPGDHWSTVVESDPRVGHNAYSMLYLTRYLEDSPYEPEGYEGEAEVHAPDPEQQDMVFVFKASLPYRKNLWRRLELFGKQTLGDFNQLMYRAFEHDLDHLSEFYIKPKDRGKNARWEGFGFHNPWESTAADQIQIAQLGLEVGHGLRYVYDFGDTIEHQLILEAIQPPSPEKHYPLIADQNKPRYRNCVSCRKQGIQSRAVWLCIWCSNEQQRDVYLCEECAQRDHEDHYIDAILY